MKIRNALIVLLAMVSLSGVALANQASYEAALAKAQAAFDKADKTGFAWTSTEDLLKDAQAAAKAGDFDKAEKMAKEAEAQANQSLKQAAEQKKAGPM